MAAQSLHLGDDALGRRHFSERFLLRLGPGRPPLDLRKGAETLLVMLRAHGESNRGRIHDFKALFAIWHILEHRLNEPGNLDGWRRLIRSLESDLRLFA